MQITKHSVVGVAYVLKLKNGEIADQTDASSPFVFIHGIGQTIPAFDQNLEGKKVGEAFEFTIAAAEGYGEYSAQLLVDVPRDIFLGAPAGTLEVGKTVPMQDNQGNPLFGVVSELMPDKVKMDFNHPLAGEDLYFSGTVVEVRPATAEELSHGHVHGPGGHHH